jgi:hypothetical protein
MMAMTMMNKQGNLDKDEMSGLFSWSPIFVKARTQRAGVLGFEPVSNFVA